MKFLYIQKSRHFAKKQDNLRHVSMYKNPDTLRYMIFHGISEIGGGGGGHFYLQKTMQFALYFYIEKMREVYLLQYQHGVPDVLVPEVHLHGRTCCRPATTPPNWAGRWYWIFRKKNPESPGIFNLTFLINLLPRPPFLHAMLGLSVCNQIPLRQFLTAIRTEHPLLLPLLLTTSLPRCFPCVCLYCPHPCCP